MPRVAYPNEVGISDPDIIEVRISTAKRRGKSTRKMPTDHILKVRHRIFGWLSPWEWGILDKLEKAIQEVLELMKSFLKTDIGVIIFTLSGSIGLIYLFFGEEITAFVLSAFKTVFVDPIQALKDFFAALIPELPGFPDIPPFTIPPAVTETGEVILEGGRNFIDAVLGLFTDLFRRIGVTPTEQPPV